MRVVVVTGAGSGIGRAVTKRLAGRPDTTVVAVDLREDAARATAESCAGASVVPYTADLSDSASARGVVAHVLAEYGRLDVLVACAGIHTFGPLLEHDPDFLDKMVATNMVGTMQLCRAAIAPMVEQGSGDVLVVTSIAGYQDIEPEPIYAPTKHAMVAFVHSVRRQLVGTGVRVMSIGPGVVLTELQGYTPDDPRVEERATAATGLRVDEVAETIDFMLSRPRTVTIRDLVMVANDEVI